MPVINVYVGRIDFGACSGMIYSYEAIPNKKVNVDGVEGFQRSISMIRIQTPDGYDLEKVKGASPYGDTGHDSMVFDPNETAKGNTGRVTQPDVWRMIRRRARKAMIKTLDGCHSFRATGITYYLENGGTLEKAQTMANHESPRTTKLYDRTRDQITLDEVERIVI
jgi:hypothetical protein